MTKDEFKAKLLRILDDTGDHPDQFRRQAFGGPGCLLEQVFPTGPLYQLATEALGGDPFRANESIRIWRPNDEFRRGSITFAKFRQAIENL